MAPNTRELPISLLSLPRVAASAPTLLVSCEYPHFDVPLLKTLDSFGDAILEPVLDGCGSQQLGEGVGQRTG